MIYILIIVFKVGYAGGAATAEFQTQEACQAAADATNEQFSGWASGTWAACFPAGRALSEGGE